jgi:hypothetical protein
MQVDHVVVPSRFAGGIAAHAIIADAGEMGQGFEGSRLLNYCT